jgi:hypothetical protein
MGITILSTFETQEGFAVNNLYLSLDGLRFIKNPTDTNFSALFTVSAYINRYAKLNGNKPVSLPTFLQTAEANVPPHEFYSNTLHGIAYRSIKTKWEGEGYTVSNTLEVGQFLPDHFIYDSSGYNFAGFNLEGYDRLGFNEQGYNAEGYNAQGYNPAGYNAEGYNYMGFNAQGYDRDGYGYDGYNEQGFDRNGNPRPVQDLSGN